MLRKKVEEKHCSAGIQKHEICIIDERWWLVSESRKFKWILFPSFIGWHLAWVWKLLSHHGKGQYPRTGGG